LLTLSILISITGNVLLSNVEDGKISCPQDGTCRFPPENGELRGFEPKPGLNILPLENGDVKLLGADQEGWEKILNKEFDTGEVQISVAGNTLVPKNGISVPKKGGGGK
jgi:hypothetical protein